MHGPKFGEVKMDKFKISSCIAVLVIFSIAYLLFWPIQINPAAWTPPVLPELIGIYEANNRLIEIERLAEGMGVGPEAVAFDKQGRIYSGLEDGNIIRLHADGSQAEIIVNTGGRPAGLQFDSAGNLIVADAVKGLLSVAPDGKIRELAQEAGGIPIGLANDLDIAQDGTIYFSDASMKYASVMKDLFEHRPYGRLLAYCPKTKTTRVLLDNLYFANGVVLSTDESFILVNEMWKYRVRRYWLEGPMRGQSDIFIKNLPGLPDNITSNGKGVFWLALLHGPEGRRSWDPLLPKPFLRKIIWRLPDFLKPAPKRCGYVVGLNDRGLVVHNLQDPAGKTYANISSVIEHDGMLYFGSIGENAIGRLPIP